MIILSAGMQKAGSAWFFNMLNDLVIAAGHQDARTLRARYHLERVMTEVNCNVGRLDPFTLSLVSLPSLFKNTYVLKTHAGPTVGVRWMVRTGRMKVLYTFRDPRDVALSLLDHSERLRRDRIKSSTTFDRILDLQQAFRFVARLLPIWEAWISLEGVWSTSYEQLLADPLDSMRLAVQHLGLELSSDTIAGVVKNYRSERADLNRTHINKAETGRWRLEFTPAQVEESQRLFGDYLGRMGYATAG